MLKVALLLHDSHAYPCIGATLIQYMQQATVGVEENTGVASAALVPHSRCACMSSTRAVAFMLPPASIHAMPFRQGGVQVLSRRLGTATGSNLQ